MSTDDLSRTQDTLDTTIIFKTWILNIHCSACWSSNTLFIYITLRPNINATTTYYFIFYYLVTTWSLITYSPIVSSIYKSSLVIMAASSAMQSILASPLTRVVSNRSTRVNQFIIIPTGYVSPVPRNASMRVRCIAKVMKCYLIVEKKKKSYLLLRGFVLFFLLLFFFYFLSFFFFFFWLDWFRSTTCLPLLFYLCVLSCPSLLFRVFRL